MSVHDTIKKLSRQLYPKGRAFHFPFGGTMDKLHGALALSEARAYADASSILDAILPDNNNFTTDDATDWERRLGIAGNSSVSLSVRKQAIIRKMNHPGTVPYRQNYRYLQAQLQAAGFNVYIYENKFASSPPGTYVTQTPEDILGPGPAGAAIHDTSVLHDTTLLHGSYFDKKIVNHIDEKRDRTFGVGTHYKNTFFIAGATVSTYASVPAIRKDEFRQLILQVKPLHMVGYLFVNYT